MPTAKYSAILILVACIISSCNYPLDVGRSQLPPDVTLLFKGRAGLINGLAFSPDGRYLAISAYSFSTNSSSIQLLDLMTNVNSLIMQTANHGGELQILQWSTFNDELVLWSSGGEIDPGIIVMNPLVTSQTPRYVSAGTYANIDNIGNLAVLRSNPLSDSYQLFFQSNGSTREALIYSDSQPISRIRWVSSYSQIALVIHDGNILGPGALFVLTMPDSSLKQISLLNNIVEFSISPSGQLVAILSVNPEAPNYSASTLEIMTIDGQCIRTIKDIGATSLVAWGPEETSVALLQENNVYSLNIIERLDIENLTEDEICLQK